MQKLGTTTYLKKKNKKSSLHYDPRKFTTGTRAINKMNEKSNVR